MTTTETRPVMRADITSIAAAAEFLSRIFDTPVLITAADDEADTPGRRGLVMTLIPFGEAA